jgi:hypothetical protein
MASAYASTGAATKITLYNGHRNDIDARENMVVNSYLRVQAMLLMIVMGIDMSHEMQSMVITCYITKTFND